MKFDNDSTSGLIPGALAGQPETGNGNENQTAACRMGPAGRKKSYGILKRICFLILFMGVTGLASTAFAAPTDSDVLASLAANGLRGAMGKMAATGEALAVASKLYCSQKDAAGLKNAQQAWKDAYIAWCRAEPFRAGPIKKLQLYKRIGLWRSNDIIYQGATTDPEFKNMLATPELRGYAAAEYILFASKDPGGDIACGHLVDVTAEIAELTSKAKAEWDMYENGFINAGDGMPYLMESEAISPVVAEILNTTEVLLRDRIGLPSNFFSGKAVPEILQAWHSGITLEGIQATLSGLHAALDGGAPNSLVGLLATKDGLVNKRNPGLARGIRKDLTKVEKILDKLNSNGKPVHVQLENSSSTMKKLYKQLMKLQAKLIDLSTGLELDVKAGLEAQFAREMKKQ